MYCAELKSVRYNQLRSEERTQCGSDLLLFNYLQNFIQYSLQCQRYEHHPFDVLVITESLLFIY